jgi:Protein of unknown function (DUF2637)
VLRPSPRNAARPGELVDRLIDLAIMVGLVVLILVGFLTSYRTLLELAVTAGGYPRWLAPAVPLSFDLGIVVLSLKVARSAREGRTAPVMRLLVAGLSAATVTANASAASTMSAKLLHAVPPAMFVICFESVIISARRRALADQDLLPSPLPRLRTAQWLLAPLDTCRLWRSRVLAQPDQAPRNESKIQAAAAAVPTRALTSRRPAIVEIPHEATPPSVAGRDAIVRELLADSPSVTAPGLRVALADRGHVVSLRTAQRLVAAVRAGP